MDTWNWQRTQKANTHFAISMQNRSRRTRKYLWLSLHSNAFASTFKGLSTSPRGIELFTSIGRTLSDRVASLILNELELALKPFSVPFRKDNSDGDGDKEAGFEELIATAMPAVLIENLFFTNETDARLLLNENYQKAFTDGIIKALLQY
jgi:N-acetylmuramoyl-L-alanine amidase